MRRKLAALLVLCQLTAISCSAAPAASGTADTASVSVSESAPAEVYAAGNARTFYDVKESDWFSGFVADMTELGWLSGMPDGGFHPNDPITAAGLVAVTARAMGLAPVSSGGHWAAGDLQAGLDRGWYDWDEIPPTGENFDQPISRQLAVKIAMRALLPDRRGDYNTQSRKIKDFASLDGRYYEPVLAAYEAGVVTGDNNGNFNPKSGLTRAEACTLVLQIYRAAQQGGGLPAPESPEQTAPAVPEPSEVRSGGVSENGRLQVVGTQLCNEKGEPVVLRGMSSHGMQWYGQYASEGAIKTTANYGANVFRIAMYTGENGYLSQPNLKNDVIAAVDAAVRQDMYAIIDWHILSDGNPRTNQTQAVAFFTEMAKRYKDTPNVLYEICNEPNGNVSWSGDVKPYAQAVVAAIRAEDSDGVILIGSPTWSQDIHLAADDPVEGTNLMYTLHFYAGTHGSWLRDRIDAALAKGLPVFVSEWGTSRADGGGGVFLQEAGEWLDFLDSRGISWCNWSLCDKNETSAALAPGASPDGGWTEKDLSESGKFVFSRFKADSQ